MPYSIRLPDGTLVQNIPDSLTPEQAKAKIIEEMPQYGSPERTYGQVATDIGAAGLKGIGSLVQLPGQLYGLATGDFSKTGTYGAGKNLEDYAQSMKSQGLQTREARAQQAQQEAEKQGQWEAFKTSLGQTVSDPALLSTFLAEQVPQLLPSLITGGAASALAPTARIAAGQVAKGLTKEAAEQVAKEAAIKAGTRAAIGTGAVQQGAQVGEQTYDEIVKHLVEKGATEEQASKAAINLARAAGVTGAALSVIANRYLPGGDTLERILAGEKTGKGIVGGALAGAAKELPSELLEETGGQLAQNLAVRQVNPQQSLTEGLGATAAQAGLGAVGLGGVGGAFGGHGPATAPKTEPSTEEKLAGTTIQQEQQAPPKAEEGETSLEDILAKGKAKEKVEKAAPPAKAPAFAPDSLEFLDQRIAEKQANYDKRQTEIERKQAINQNPKNQIVKNQQVAAEIAAMQQARDARLAAGETYATRTEQGAGGEGAAVSGPAASATDTAGLETPQRDGVVPPEQNADQLATGEAGKPAPVVLPPELQAAKDLIDAVDKGGVPLNTGKLNSIARSIGLEVSKSAKPEETIPSDRLTTTLATEAEELAIAGPKVIGSIDLKQFDKKTKKKEKPGKDSVKDIKPVEKAAKTKEVSEPQDELAGSTPKPAPAANVNSAAIAATKSAATTIVELVVIRDAEPYAY